MEFIAGLPDRCKVKPKIWGGKSGGKLMNFHHSIMFRFLINRFNVLPCKSKHVLMRHVILTDVLSVEPFAAPTMGKHAITWELSAFPDSTLVALFWEVGTAVHFFDCLIDVLLDQICLNVWCFDPSGLFNIF